MTLKTNTLGGLNLLQVATVSKLEEVQSRMGSFYNFGSKDAIRKDDQLSFVS
jgi:hypothetical protein